MESHNEALFTLFYIVKCLLGLGDIKVIDILVSKEHYLDTFGALECTISFFITPFSIPRRP